jgi:crotonobetainyl-CoA:carnitine CoA-transferase CaiB-like acyl-CoA transferase
MQQIKEEKGLLSGYRVLDLTEGGYLICGKILADLGADVVKIEPPQGSCSRAIGPFYKDILQSEKSLFWFAYNVNKRGITLDIAKSDGKKIFLELVKKTDFIIESFPPSYLKDLGIGYTEIAQINPKIIMVSITPYGQNGPKATYKSDDIGGFASSGVLYATGYPNRPPVLMGYPMQASMQAGTEAATAALIAHWYRGNSGIGQHVDVSMQETNIQLLQSLIEIFDLTKTDYKRAGNFWVTGTGLKRDLVFRCKDGYVAFTVLGGSAGPAKSTSAMVSWMNEEGKAPQWLKEIDWINGFDIGKLAQEEFDRIQEPFAKFFITKTKKELWERSAHQRIILAPLNTIADLCDFVQLKEREMWVKLDHPELGTDLTYLGPFVKLSEAPITFRRRAPTIGEDNEAIYIDEFGFSKKELYYLKLANVI